MSFLSQSEIVRLLRGEWVTDEWPWNTGDEATIEKHYKDVLAEVCRKCCLREKTVWDHYGSGYASFVDCWLYREEPGFRAGTGSHYHGMVLLLSRLSRFYIVGEGEKSWHAKGGASYLPDAGFVDKLRTPAVVALVEPVTAILDARGLARLRPADLAESLPLRTRVPTILGDPPFTHFDALFYWED